MCGIAGFVNRDGDAADRELLAKMTATIAHRGPDGDGFFLEGPAGLGHRRLSIIDVEGGSQPMAISIARAEQVECTPPQTPQARLVM